MAYLVSPMLLQLLVELQGDAHHHFGLVPVGVGDVVQDAIEICGAEDNQVTNETQAKPFFLCYSWNFDTLTHFAHMEKICAPSRQLQFMQLQNPGN